MKRKIRRLTPNMLKKIINEERLKLRKAHAKSRRRKSKTTSTKIKSNIKFLQESKKEQRKLVLRFKKLFRKRQKAKKNLIERL